MYNDFNDAKRTYEETPIPPELDTRVRDGIRQGQRKYRRRWLSRGATVVACFAVLIAALNLSPSIAAAASEVPVLGPLFQILTIRDTTDSNEDRTIQIEQPVLEGGGSFAQTVNDEIQKRVDEKTAEGEEIIAEYKQAFLDTGGTQEEWEAHDAAFSVTYEVKSQTDTVVSFLIESSCNFTTAYWERAYYNLDLSAGTELTLADLLGEDWVTLCNESIRQQMAEEPDVYWLDEFSSVDETTPFYINEDGTPVVVFSPYAVAPGVMGYVEFTIS